MPTDAKSIRIQIDADPRFAAGAGGAAHYVAESAGMAHDAASELQTATVSACLEAFSSVPPARPRLEVALTPFDDRVEVAISREGAAPAGADTSATSSAKALSGVDRVQYEQLGNASVTRLTKYLRHS